MFVGRLFSAIATPNLFTRRRQTRKKRRRFWGRKTRSGPATPTFSKRLKSAACLRWVGFGSVEDDSRQLLLVPVRPEIISSLWFMLAAGSIPASASIWVLGIVCGIRSTIDAAASASSPSPGQRTETFCLSAASAIEPSQHCSSLNSFFPSKNALSPSLCKNQKEN